MFLLLSLFDLVGISIIAPYINLINNPNSTSFGIINTFFILLWL